jgi:hypothetical protein
MDLNIRLLSVAILLIICSTVCSQQNRSSIHFETGQHNLGRINEADGPFQHEFVFVNKGVDPLLVANVRAGAGLSVRWTRSPVQPGDTGTVSVEFNPQNMPGRFNRTIILSATGNPSSVTLRLLGEVIPRDKTPGELFPHQTGLLRMRSNHISFGYVTPLSVKRDSMEVINLSKEDIDLDFTAIPGHVTLEAVPRTLKPGENGFIRASWNAGQIEEWGVVTKHFRL